MTTSTPDLSRLRIDRGDPPPTPRRGAGPWIPIGLGLLVVLAIGASLVLGPRPREVHVALAAATGGGSVTGAGITANGYVVARTKASVSAKIPGRMCYLGVGEGSHVRRGQVIARLESGDYRAALLAARAAAAATEVQLAQARRDLERSRSLRASNVISDAELESATTRASTLAAQLDEQRAQVALARANLENTNVRAPFDGTVLRKDAEVGEIVAPSSAGGGLTRTAIATMADLGTLEVEVDVNEAYIAQVHSGQACRITLDAYPDTSFAGRTRQVVPTADRQKATVQVKVSILDRDPRILPEMGAKVEFVRETSAERAVAARRVLVPSAAVTQDAAGARVWVVEDGRALARTVDLGATRGDQVEIRRGLNGGESVVLDPAGLKQGARVRVKTG